MFYRYSSGRPNVSITAKFGWASVPDDVVQACLVQAAHLYKASASVLGLVQLGMEGNAWRLSSKLNPIAEGLLADYVVKE
jgi:hypothetical protein